LGEKPVSAQYISTIPIALEQGEIHAPKKSAAQSEVEAAVKN
jgi:inorganic triphosphatase YgiF